MKKRISSIAICAVMILGVASQGWSIDKAEETDRVENAAKVLTEITNTPDKGIPDAIMKDAECVAVVPSLVKGGFVFGGQYGRGVPHAITPTAGAHQHRS